MLHGKTMNYKEYPKALTNPDDFPDELLFAWSSGSLIEMELEVLQEAYQESSSKVEKTEIEKSIKQLKAALQIFVDHLDKV